MARILLNINKICEICEIINGKESGDRVSF
jgi:hypothetical protein